MLAVLVIDAAEQSILRQLMASGRAPVLAELASRGLELPLRSDADVMDGAVFQTMLTGAGPGVHGMYKYRQLVPGTYRYEFSRADATPVPQVWQELSARGRRCCLFDVPKTFPSADFDGVLVSAWSAYSAAHKPASIPGGLLRELQQRYGSHPQPKQESIPLSPPRYEQIRDRLVRAAHLRGEICRDLLARGDFAFFMTAYSESHVAGHQFWHLRDAEHPRFDARAAHSCTGALEDIYAAIDVSIGRIADALPRDADVMVLTQQGLQNNFSGSPFIPEWLRRRSGRPGRSVCRRFPVRLAAGLGPSLRGRLGEWLPRALTDRWISRKYAPRGEDVFMLAGSEFMTFLRVNMAGREPDGTVPVDRYESVLRELKSDLLAVVNPATGQPAVARVAFPQECYSGPCADGLPDVVVCWKADAPLSALRCPRVGLIEQGVVFTEQTHSNHTGEGLAILTGPAIGKGRREEPLSMSDLTAVWYGLLGEAVPPHVEANGCFLDR